MVAFLSIPRVFWKPPKGSWPMSWNPLTGNGHGMAGGFLGINWKESQAPLAPRWLLPPPVCSPRPGKCCLHLARLSALTRLDFFAGFRSCFPALVHVKAQTLKTFFEDNADQERLLGWLSTVYFFGPLRMALTSFKFSFKPKQKRLPTKRHTHTHTHTLCPSPASAMTGFQGCSQKSWAMCPRKPGTIRKAQTPSSPLVVVSKTRCRIAPVRNGTKWRGVQWSDSLAVHRIVRGLGWRPSGAQYAHDWVSPVTLTDTSHALSQKMTLKPGKIL